MTAYTVNCYREVTDDAKVAAYVEIAGPAIAAAGGRFLARGLPAATHEAGLTQRTIIVEFDSVEAAEAAYASEQYAEALAALGDGAVRDVRVVPGVA